MMLLEQVLSFFVLDALHELWEAVRINPEVWEEEDYIKWLYELLNLLDFAEHLKYIKCKIALTSFHFFIYS